MCGTEKKENEVTERSGTYIKGSCVKERTNVRGKYSRAIGSDTRVFLNTGRTGNL